MPTKDTNRNASAMNTRRGNSARVRSFIAILASAISRCALLLGRITVTGVAVRERFSVTVPFVCRGIDGGIAAPFPRGEKSFHGCPLAPESNDDVVIVLGLVFPPVLDVAPPLPL